MPLRKGKKTKYRTIFTHTHQFYATCAIGRGQNFFSNLFKDSQIQKQIISKHKENRKQ